MASNVSYQFCLPHYCREACCRPCDSVIRSHRKDGWYYNRLRNEKTSVKCDHTLGIRKNLKNYHINKSPGLENAGTFSSASICNINAVDEEVFVKFNYSFTEANQTACKMYVYSSNDTGWEHTKNT